MSTKVCACCGQSFLTAKLPSAPLRCRPSISSKSYHSFQRVTAASMNASQFACRQHVW